MANKSAKRQWKVAIRGLYKKYIYLSKVPRNAVLQKSKINQWYRRKIQAKQEEEATQLSACVWALFACECVCARVCCEQVKSIMFAAQKKNWNCNNVEKCMRHQISKAIHPGCTERKLCLSTDLLLQSEGRWVGHFYCILLISLLSAFC